MGARENQPLYSDKDLLNFLWKDDNRGMEILFKLHYQPLYKFVYLIIKDQPLAEDVVQEVFINLWRVRHNLQGNTQFKPYLFRACKNLSFNKLKAAQKRKFTDDALMDFPQVTASVSDLLESKQLSEYLNQIIQKLPPKRQLIFRLSRFEQMTYQEIAGHLDISVKTVENQMTTALRTLRVELEKFI